MSEQGLAPPPTFCNRMDEPRIAELLAPFLSSKGQRHEQALQDFSRVTHLQPKLAIAYYERGLIYNAT